MYLLNSSLLGEAGKKLISYLWKDHKALLFVVILIFGLLLLCILIIFAATILLTITSDTFINQIGMTDFVTDNSYIISWSRFFSGMILLVSFFIVLSVFAGYKIQIHRRKRMSIKALRDLTRYEKQRLIEFIKDNTKTRYFTINGITTGLEKKGVLYQSTDEVVEYEKKKKTYYNIYDYIWDELKKHPELLEIESIKT